MSGKCLLTRIYIQILQIDGETTDLQEGTESTQSTAVNMYKVDNEKHR